MWSHSPHSDARPSQPDAEEFQSVWRESPHAQLSSLNGQAIVDRAIEPNRIGRVKYRASWWAARCLEEIVIPVGEAVKIVGTQGITLLVEPTVLLKATQVGLGKVQQAWQHQGWNLQSLQPNRGQPAADSAGQAPMGQAPIVVAANLSASEPIATETWQRFIQGKPIYYKTFKACCDFLGLDWQDLTAERTETPPSDPLAPPVVPHAQPHPTAEPSFKFVGRDQAIAELDQLVQAGAKIITILGTGGLGKTTLARRYFDQQGFDLVLECWMAKETRNLTAAENIVQEWLQRHLGERPARKFGVSLERLRQRLRQSTVNGTPVKVGVLIDNLETALDRHGRLVESHRPYAALLEVLADPLVKCVTLVTSREPLHEVNVTVEPYPLPSLDVTAWQQFFDYHHIHTVSPDLEQMHQAYSGNAKAMTILSSVIKVDYESRLTTYWQEHQTDLLAETSLESLIESHFARLRQLYPEAYRLLCRMGCYRYQDIVNVPIEGLFCLLWDVPETEHRRVIRFLKELFLIEEHEHGYHLHPTIQAKAIELLHQRREWELANRQAARFWTESITTIETIDDALMALEAYHHHIQLQDWEAAAAVILKHRNGQWVQEEPLGVSFYRLGLLQPMIAAITRIIEQIHPGTSLGNLHRILGDLYWLRGSVHRAIHSHEQAREIALTFEIEALELVSLFNIGLCKIDLWELDEAFQLFSTVNQRAAGTEHHVYAVGAWFCLALLHSYWGHRDVAEKLIQQVSQEFSVLSTNSWSRCYSLLFLGSATKNLGEVENAQRLYELAQFFAERSQYVQVKARALIGLAELAWQRLDFQSAIANLLAARELLTRLEARGDLAEVHYQLGLTYDKLDELAASQANFAAAVEIFQEMNAPKQVERVEKSIAAIASH
jgi:tetratricopeptide (TPR) repeat protein